MPTTPKILQGVVRLTAGDYQMVMPSTANQSTPNRLANTTIEEVFIITDSTAGPVTITLPQITLFYGRWNAKIYVNDISLTPNGTTVNPYTSEIDGNTINGFFTSQVIGNVGTNYYHIVSDFNWMCLIAQGILPLT